MKRTHFVIMLCVAHLLQPLHDDEKYRRKYNTMVRKSIYWSSQIDAVGYWTIFRGNYVLGHCCAVNAVLLISLCDPEKASCTTNFCIEQDSSSMSVTATSK